MRRAIVTQLKPSPPIGHLKSASRIFVEKAHYFSETEPERNQMTLTADMLINRALSGAIAAAALLMTNLTSHAAPLTAAEATNLALKPISTDTRSSRWKYTRQVMTNVEKPEGTKAPMGQLIRLREYPNASFQDVTAPNADTLYTTCFLDVGKEP